ncbi:4-amino-4-deoxy-L-arabinose-phosphoundecaprenol flippase subunit ArnE [uncultured archaeon]|nr:4-amino-4-deoxy-L-arabinose-phosphoundecaprenol flippase subunit ArnE [uncultured archaeon]
MEVMIYYLFAMLSILLTGVGQTLIKIGAHNDNTLFGIYFNPATATGYFLFLIVTISSVLALKGIDLKVFYALTSLNYIVVMILSRVVLKEEMSRNKLQAMCLIVLGVIVFNS